MEITQKIKTKDIFVRFIVVLLGLGFWLIYRVYFLTENKKPWDYQYCFNDRITTYVLLDLTRWLSQHWDLRNFLMISASNLLDIFFISFLIVWVKNGKSWRPLLHLFMFYGIRNALVQSMVLLEFYDTYIFGDPEFPSIVVPFVRAPDFFYSGHSGCAIILGMQLRDLGYSEMMYVGLLLSFYEGFVLTVTRGHYSMDIIFGMLMAHYVYFHSTKFGNFLDKRLPIWGRVEVIVENSVEEVKIETSSNIDNEKGIYNNIDTN